MQDVQETICDNFVARRSRVTGASRENLEPHIGLRVKSRSRPRWGHEGNGACIILINRPGWRQSWLRADWKSCPAKSIPTYTGCFKSNRGIAPYGWNAEWKIRARHADLVHCSRESSVVNQNRWFKSLRWIDPCRFFRFGFGFTKLPRWIRLILRTPHKFNNARRGIDTSRRYIDKQVTRICTVPEDLKRAF